MPGSNDTIFALSSGRPPAAIAVIRISGPNAGVALKALTGRIPEPRKAHLARLRDPHSGEIIDEALGLWFPAPHSETGEDTAELQLHGGRAVIAATVAALSRIEGLRPAEAGEFTRRAFENGKLDLTAVEGLADLVGAETEGQRRQAFRQMKGLLGNRAEDWRQRLIRALALVEARIDFSDEADVPEDLVSPALAIVRELGDEIEAALADGGRGERLREGLVVAIAGPPNAGKSTLLNRIARREAAIVSPYAGTTRDVIEVHLDLGGVPVTLLDTAGIRDTDDPIEREGVRRARDRAAAADLVLWVEDMSAAAGQPMADRGVAGSAGHLRTAGGRLTECAAGAGPGGPLADGERGAAAESGEASIRTSAQVAPVSGDARALPSGTAAAQVWLIRNKADLLPPAARTSFGQPHPAASPDLSPGGASGVRGGARRGVPWIEPYHRGPVSKKTSYISDLYKNDSESNLTGNNEPNDQANKPLTNMVNTPLTANSESNYQINSPITNMVNEKLTHKNELDFYSYDCEFLISATSGAGFEQFLASLQSFAEAALAGGESALISRARHRRALEETAAALQRAQSPALAGHEDLVAEEIRIAARSLGSLTGRVDVEDVLDVIFRDFCIGK